MKVQPNPGLVTELLREFWKDIKLGDEDRINMHPSVTDLIGCLTKSWWDVRAQLEPDDKAKMFMLIGLGLEKSLLVSHRDGVSKGSKDGVFFHSDSWQGGRLLELKSTRGSKKKYDEGDFPERYLRQIKSYCVEHGVREVDLAVIFVIPAELTVYHIEFSELELHSHWKWVLARKAVWDQAVEENQAPPSFQTNEEWECKGCVYKLICDTRKALSQ